jgi:hypothetical protein
MYLFKEVLMSKYLVMIAITESGINEKQYFRSVERSTPHEIQTTRQIQQLGWDIEKDCNDGKLDFPSGTVSVTGLLPINE